MYADPSGEFFVTALIGAAISVVVNGISNVIHGQSFFDGAGMAAITGFVGGGFAWAIGGAVSASTMSSFGKFAFQTISHSMLGGWMSGFSGGDVGAGMLAGAFGSMASAAVGGIFKGASKFAQGAAMIGAGGLSGGVGSVLAGGDFWDGARNGLISAGLNHAVHSGIFGKGLAIAAFTGRFRHIFGPDGYAISATADVSGIISVEMEGGGMKVKTKNGWVKVPMADLGEGIGWIEASVNGGITELYHSGAISEISVNDYFGIRWEGNISASVFGLSIGYSVSYSYVSNNNNYILGFSNSLGVGFSPTIISGYGTYGATGRNFREAGNYINNDLYKKLYGN